MAVKCPGYNAKVASGTAWDFASEATADATAKAAQAKADAKGAANANAAFARNLCPPPCASFPVIKFGKRGVSPLAVDPKADFKIAIAYTEWELDVICARGPKTLDELLQGEPEKPPEPEPGEKVGGGLVVVHVCKTEVTELLGSGFTRIRRVRCLEACKEAERACQVLRYPRAPLMPKRWRVEPNSEGGAEIREKADHLPDYLICACLKKG